MVEFSNDSSVNPFSAITPVLALAGIVQHMMTDALDFVIKVDPPHGSVLQGGVITTIVAIESNHKYFRKYENTVNLSILDPTADIKISFSPESDRPFYQSITTIKTESDAQIGDHEIIINGCGADGKEHSCKYRLNIKPDNLKVTSSSRSKPLLSKPLQITEANKPNSPMII